jgi:choline dehydrogenase
MARHGRMEAIHAETEVLLSAGAYNSPQLLMLSGIGPAADLAALQIAVRGDLPVGVGLQDQSHGVAELVYRHGIPFYRCNT